MWKWLKAVFWNTKKKNKKKQKEEEYQRCMCVAQLFEFHKKMHQAPLCGKWNVWTSSFPFCNSYRAERAWPSKAFETSDTWTPRGRTELNMYTQTFKRRVVRFMLSFTHSKGQQGLLVPHSNKQTNNNKNKSIKSLHGTSPSICIMNVEKTKPEM